MNARSSPANATALAKAQAIAIAEIEALGFAMDQKRRQSQVSLEEYAELSARRKEMARLLRMMGGEAPELEEVTG